MPRTAGRASNTCAVRTADGRPFCRSTPSARRRSESGLDRERGCCGTADTLVQFDETYGAVVRSLLARTVVCENMDAALAMARSRGHRFRIVTLDGQIIQPGGAMTGGSASRGTGALARAGRLRAAEEQAERCEAARKTAEQRFRAAEKQLHDRETACETQNAALRRQAEAQAALAAACTQHRALLGSAQARQEELMQQQRSMEAEKQRSAEVARVVRREGKRRPERSCGTRKRACRPAGTRSRGSVPRLRSRKRSLPGSVPRLRAQRPSCPVKNGRSSRCGRSDARRTPVFRARRTASNATSVSANAYRTSLQRRRRRTNGRRR
ncbi:MAG: hypothetical protein ACLR4Z_14720 [Butyricicoccaceae bacterium]